MHGQTPRLYYGWIVVAIGFFTMMLVMGTFFSSGVLFAAIIAEYGWSRAVTALPFSVALICYAFTAWLAGRLFDRYGPQLLFPLGVVCLGVGILLSTWASTTWHWCLSWGVLVAQGFNLAGIAPHLALAALWFNRQRGVASGLMLSGASMGALVVVPGVQYLVEQYGWRFAYTVLGVVVMGCLLPLNALWQRHHPAVLGLYPDGATTPPPALLDAVSTQHYAPTLDALAGHADGTFLVALSHGDLHRLAGEYHQCTPDCAHDRQWLFGAPGSLHSGSNGPATGRE